jgi:gamma-glutamyl-gamma-aminobutyrate hydrolase PuuD
MPNDTQSKEPDDGMMRWSDLLLGNNLVTDATVDERSQLVGRLLDVRGLLGHGELLEKLVQDLDRLLVLGRHDVDLGFYILGYKEENRSSKRQRSMEESTLL